MGQIFFFIEHQKPTLYTCSAVFSPWEVSMQSNHYVLWFFRQKTENRSRLLGMLHVTWCDATFLPFNEFDLIWMRLPLSLLHSMFHGFQWKSAFPCSNGFENQSAWQPYECNLSLCCTETFFCREIVLLFLLARAVNNLVCDGYAPLLARDNAHPSCPEQIICVLGMHSNACLAISSLAFN